jgi:hypothetical protein
MSPVSSVKPPGHAGDVAERIEHVADTHHGEVGLRFSDVDELEV